MNFKELIREVRPLRVIDDLQYIEALEFNGDKEFFNLEELKKKKKLQFFEREGIKKEIKEIKEDDYFIPGTNYSLSNNNKIVTKTSDDNWNCTCIGNLIVNKGIHRWSLKILNSPYPQNPEIMIGIVPSNINQSDIKNYTKCGWYLYCYGTLNSGPPFNYRNKTYHGSKIPFGSIIDVELDISKSTIKYFINGVDKGIAYEGIPQDQPLRLAIEIDRQNDSIELLSYSQK